LIVLHDRTDLFIIASKEVVRLVSSDVNRERIETLRKGISLSFHFAIQVLKWRNGEVALAFFKVWSSAERIQTKKMGIGTHNCSIDI
jgi:hypothetical protein